jgi:hypothetical protein
MLRFFVLLDQVKRQLLDLLQQAGLVVPQAEALCLHLIGGRDVGQVMIDGDILAQFLQGRQPIGLLSDIFNAPLTLSIFPDFRVVGFFAPNSRASGSGLPIVDFEV